MLRLDGVSEKQRTTVDGLFVTTCVSILGGGQGGLVRIGRSSSEWRDFPKRGLGHFEDESTA